MLSYLIKPDVTEGNLVLFRRFVRECFGHWYFASEICLINAFSVWFLFRIFYAYYEYLEKLIDFRKHKHQHT